MPLQNSRLALPLMAVLTAPAALAQTDLLELPATDVTGLREQTSYKPEQSESALKIDAALRDIPQSIKGKAGREICRKYRDAGTKVVGRTG